MFTEGEFKGRVKEMLNAAGITDVPEVYIKGEIARRRVQRMTGIENLRKEMIERGCTTAQAESKTVMVVLDIIANSGKKYADLWEQEHKETEKLRKLRDEAYRAQRSKEQAEADRRKAERELEEAEQKYDEYCDYIGIFNENLIQCETEQGRDTMRRAQLFVNSVNIDSKYDNTAYIVGLAAILSNGECGAITELKKINPKLFDKDTEFSKMKQERKYREIF